MAFDQKTRNLLQRTVSACRNLLDAEFAAQRRSIFGINDDGTAASLETLSHLSDEDMQTAKLLRDRLDHLVAGLVSQGKKDAEARKEAVGRVTREQAFTVLNRLAALRMSEEREIVLECVRQGTASEGFQLFMQTAGGALGTIFDSYRCYLFLLFDELAIDLGVLFSRWDPAGLLFPRQEALEAVLHELNGTGTAATREDITPEAFNAIWAEDETIGWIYQYYNDQAERKKMRDESSAPRNSRELAVRNQFFTPRYVVEFLTDNTLGRIWYEMTQGDTKLKEQCRYLVRRPNEIFLATGETPPAENQEPETKNQELSQSDLLKQPVHIPHRPLKDPRTILMLDPACGSMHFGLYAFDLFEVIYDEAWALEEKLGPAALSRPPGMKSLHDTYAGKDAFLKDVPRLIIEHNLHGIDIDPRCAQIAGLSLWLRAQKAWQRLGLKPAERPAIKRSNIVCAEPMPGEKELLREFVEREFPVEERSVFLRLLEVIFDKMQLAGEAGSLLKIEEEIRAAIAAAKQSWKEGPKLKQSKLFGEGEPIVQQGLPMDLTGITDEQFWERVEHEIYDALKKYAEQAENGGGFQRRLFAEDAARGFAFIDVCRKRYDVALMNPPFGEAPKLISKRLDASYIGSGGSELCASFYSRVLELLNHQGFFGSISSRTLFFLFSLAEWRREIAFERSSIELFADLGTTVLDGAVNETAAYVVAAHKPTTVASRFGMFHDMAEQGSMILDLCSALPKGDRIYIRPLSDFQRLSDKPLCYWVSTHFVNSVPYLTPLGEDHASVQMGLAPRDEFRFSRLWWETPSNCPHVWIPYAKGGEMSAYYCDVDLVLNSLDDLKEIKACLNAKYPYLKGNLSWVLHPENSYFEPGLTFGQRTSLLRVSVLPAGCYFSVAGKGVFGRKTSTGALLQAINTPTCQFLVSLRRESWDMNPQFQEGDVARIPWPDFTEEVQRRLESVGQMNTNLVRTIASNDEADHAFIKLETSANFERSKSAALAEIQANEAEADSLFASLVGLSMDDTSFVETRISPRWESRRASNWFSTTPRDEFSYTIGCAYGRWDIRYATGEQAAPELPDPFAPLPVCPPGQLQNAQGLPARPEDVPAAYPVRIPWDGILVDDPSHPLDIEHHVREVIEIIRSGREGGPTAEAIEHEACEILGVKSLRDYFRKPAGFFADHLKRYSKSRRQAPIYWPLSTASGSYTLWIYYHRLTPDTLYKAIALVEAKTKDIEEEILRLRTMRDNDEAGTKERDQLKDRETFLNELKDLHAELNLWAPKWKPNLNDGVIITASPLWKLFRLPKWRKDLEACWKDLNAGDYDWAHLAHTLWPTRVREKCKKDRSLAIAHGLEELCEIKAPVPKQKRAAKKAAKKTGKQNSNGEQELL